MQKLKTLPGVFVDNMKKNKLHKASGFTLIEVAIIVIISSLLLFSIFKALALYSEQTARNVTAENLDVLDASLSRFFQQNDRYPCPAPLNVLPDDPQFGYEQCVASSNPGATPNNLNIAGHISGTPLDNEDPAVTTPTAEDRVMIGAFPINTVEPCFLTPDASCNTRDLYLTEEKIYDGYGNKMTYAVTEALTDSATYRDTGGGIEIEDENGQSLLENPFSAHFVIVSHGPNGRGAYNRQGSLVQDNCAPPPAVVLPPGSPTPPAPPLSNNERDNCDHDDGIFVSALFNDNPGSNQFYDDSITYRLVELSALFERTGTDEMININDGNIGIGNFPVGGDAPSAPLHVRGDLQATDLFADKLCNTDITPLCFRPAFFGGPAEKTADASDPFGFVNTCPDGQAIVKIANNSVICQPVYTTPIIDGRCAEDDPLTTSVNEYEVMVGYSNDTGVICQQLYP